MSSYKGILKNITKKGVKIFFVIFCVYIVFSLIVIAILCFGPSW